MADAAKGQASPLYRWFDLSSSVLEMYGATETVAFETTDWDEHKLASLKRIFGRRLEKDSPAEVLPLDAEMDGKRLMVRWPDRYPQDLPGNVYLFKQDGTWLRFRHARLDARALQEWMNAYFQMGADSEGTDEEDGDA
jgi:hypothetical protein